MHISHVKMLIQQDSHSYGKEVARVYLGQRPVQVLTPGPVNINT